MDTSNIKPVVLDPKFTIPNDICDDIICRFLLNLPMEEKFDPIRVCFQVELAHWYFLDYYCSEGCSSLLAQLKNIPYNQFAYTMYQKTPHLKVQLSEIDMHLAAFREYKMRVPTYGAILMNQNLTKAVLVQGFRSNWGFPKGKVNEVEEPVMCAAREVFEETGYDIKPLVNKQHYIESRVFERNDRLYLVRGVDTNFKFEPQTQFEIKNIKWFNIDELPENKKDTNPVVARSGVPNSSFYSVYPYVKRLRLWIADKLEGKNKIHNFRVWQDGGDAGMHQGSPNTSSNQRKSNRNQQQLMTSTPGKILEPFQFPQHFLQSGGGGSVTSAGWQLFPTPQQQSEGPPQQVISSNALQELLYSQQFKQSQANVTKQTPPINTAPKNNPKNPRRRLFTEETPAAQGQQQIVGVIGKPASSKSSKKKAPAAQFQPQQQTQPLKCPESELTQLLHSSAWANFSFDREKVYKAFFTPPLPTTTT